MLKLPQRDSLATTVCPLLNANFIMVKTHQFKLVEENYKFFGMEYRFECFCGFKIENGFLELQPGDCKWNCTGNESETCGGDGRMSLYRGMIINLETHVMDDTSSAI